MTQNLFDRTTQTLLTVPIDRQHEPILTDRSTRPSNDRRQSSTRNNDIEHGEVAGDTNTKEKGLKEADG